MNTLTLGTRGSPLAMAQTQIIRDLLERAHPALRIEVKTIQTSGDQFLNLSLSAGAGKGLFTKEIEEKLLANEIDVAIHSLKDLPTQLPEGLTIGAVPAREDAHDVFVAKLFNSLDELPQGAHVATSSIRRRAQLLARRPDLRIEEIRGNVGTRLQKLANNPGLDAMILAAAGLKRLGLWHKVPGLRWWQMDFDEMIPAVGQGIIGCEVREADLDTQELLARINHPDTLACAEAERAFLHAMGGGCQVPYAAHATVLGLQMRLAGAKFEADGTNARRGEATGPKDEARELGEQVARQVRG
jgi:hydroxymethylbilane synthase